MAEKTSQRQIGKGALVSSVGIFCSRLSGLARDMILSRMFGTGVSMSAFILAFTIPNLFRRFFGEGALSEAFVPLFNHRLEKEGKAASFLYLSRILSLLTLFLVATCGVAIGVAFLVRPLFTDAQGALALRILPVLLPYMVFICLTGFLSGVLHSFGKFALPSFAPILLNGCLIVAAFFLPDILKTYELDPAFGLAAGVTVAGILQLLILIPVLRRLGFHWRPKNLPDKQELRQLGLLIIPGMLTAGMYQINVLADRFIAGWLGAEAVTSLYYSERLVYLPVGVFAVALSMACLPVMSRAFARDDHKDMVEAVFYSLRHVLFLSLPCLLLLVILGRQTIVVLFRGGAFDDASLDATLSTMLCYSAGIPAFAAVKIVRSAFFSKKDTRTPMRISLVCMVLNIILNLILMQYIQQRGLALATAITSYINLICLLIFLFRDIKPGRSELAHIFPALIKIGVALAASGAAMYYSAQAMADANRWLAFGVPAIAGAAAYLAASAICKSRELTELLQLLKLK